MHVFKFGAAHLAQLDVLALKPAWEEVLAQTGVEGDICLFQLDVGLGSHVSDWAKSVFLQILFLHHFILKNDFIIIINQVYKQIKGK